MTTPPASASSPPVLNIANVLTVLRLLLVPVFLVVLFVDDGNSVAWRLIASGVFAVAAITDRLDGQLARSRGLVTDFGAVADPIADKALTGAAWIGLSILGFMPWWITIVIIGREIGVTLLRFWVIRHGVIAASRGGKAKTFVQSLAIGLYVLPLAELLGPSNTLTGVRWVVLGLALVLTVVTGADYVVRAVRLRAAARTAVHDVP